MSVLLNIRLCFLFFSIRININNQLPRMVQQQLDNAKFCPCGNPCISNFVPYVKPFDIGKISQSISYNDIYNMSAIVKMVGYLCSPKCYNKWHLNPNTLFTTRNR